jgi:hypothetical protein
MADPSLFDSGAELRVASMSTIGAGPGHADDTRCGPGCN